MISVGSVGVAEVGNEDGDEDEDSVGRVSAAGVSEDDEDEDKGEDPVRRVDAADDDEDEDEEEGGCEGELDAKEHEHGWMEDISKSRKFLQSLL